MKMRKNLGTGLKLALCVALVFVGAMSFAAGEQESAAVSVDGKIDTSGMRIALCNNYAGNAWRQAFIKGFEEAGAEAVATGQIKEAKVFNTAENSATEQAALLQNLVLEGYDAIVLNAASPTALNGACKAAAEAGVYVLSVDGIVTEPSAWRLNFDYPSMCYEQMKYFNERLGGKGNILSIRGLAGTSIDP